MTGRHSKWLPERLAERYEEARADTELVVLRDEIALTDARLTDLLSRVDTGESGHIWRMLRGEWEDLLAARTASDAAAMGACLNSIGKLIDQGLSDYATWDEIGKVLEQRRKLSESERRRLVDLQQMITAERLTILLSALLSIIREHVDDHRTRTAIAEHIRRLVSVEPGGRP